MKEFLEKSLQQRIIIREDREIYKNLPLAYRGRYEFFRIEMNGILWMAIHPKGEVGLVMLRKDREKIEILTHLNCAIFFDRTSFYIKTKLMEEGIPFVIDGKQVFLPFIGYLLCANNDRKIVPVHLISYLTQKMFLTAIYEKWNGIRVSDAAKKLGVSPKSASRCFDEIEYLNIDILEMHGKSRVITVPLDRETVWKQTVSLLRNPVIKKFALSEDLKLPRKGGISALSEYSLLSDNNYPTYAVTKKELSSSGVKTMRQADPAEKIGCVVLELGYFVDCIGGKIQDPLSVVLSLEEESKDDERVKSSIHQMMEEHVWLKD